MEFINCVASTHQQQYIIITGLGWNVKVATYLRQFNDGPNQLFVDFVWIDRADANAFKSGNIVNLPNDIRKRFGRLKVEPVRAEVNTREDNFLKSFRHEMTHLSDDVFG